MIFDDSIGDGQPQPGAAGFTFGGKKRVSNSLKHLCGHATTLVRDLYQRLASLASYVVVSRMAGSGSVNA